MHVLVVDDDPTMIGIATRLLEKREPGLKVVPATCLEDAMGLAQENAFDAIVLDLRLPDSIGLESLHGMMRVAGGTPIIVLSATSDHTTIRAALDAGAEDFIVKGQDGTQSLPVRVLNAVMRRGRNARFEEGHHVRRRDELVRQFLNEANHELRTPLTSIGVARTALARDKLDAVGRERLARNLERLQHTIEDFLGMLSNPVLEDIPLQELIGQECMHEGEPLHVIGNRQAFSRAFRAIRRIVGDGAEATAAVVTGQRIRIRFTFHSDVHPEEDHPVLLALTRQHLEQSLGSMSLRVDEDCILDVIVSRSIRPVGAKAAARAL